MKARRGINLDDNSRCFFKKSDPAEVKRVIIRNCLSAYRYSLYRSFAYKESADCALREYSAKYGYSLKVDINNASILKYVCPIANCHFVCQYTQKDGEFQLKYFHDHDTNVFR